MNTLAAIGSAIAGIFNFLLGRSSAKNTAEMKAGDVARKDSVVADKAAADVKAGTGGDLEQLRKDAAE